MINRTTTGAVLGLVLLLTAAVPVVAQDGFSLKVGAAFNSSDVEDQGTGLRLSDAAGWSVGAEYLLPIGIAVGLSGYTAGSPKAFSLSEGSLIFLADANYFLDFPGLPLTPYVGLHVGLGSHQLRGIEGVRPDVDFGDRGYQVGARLQLTSQLGIDAQYRRVSGSLSGEQGTDFERNQFLLSVALF